MCLACGASRILKTPVANVVECFARGLEWWSSVLWSCSRTRRGPITTGSLNNEFFFVAQPRNANMAVRRGFFDQYSVFCVFGSVVGCVVVPLITQVSWPTFGDVFLVITLPSHRGRSIRRLFSIVCLWSAWRWLTFVVPNLSVSGECDFFRHCDKFDGNPFDEASEQVRDFKPGKYRVVLSRRLCVFSWVGFFPPPCLPIVNSFELIWAKVSWLCVLKVNLDFRPMWTRKWKGVTVEKRKTGIQRLCKQRRKRNHQFRVIRQGVFVGRTPRVRKLITLRVYSSRVVLWSARIGIIAHPLGLYCFNWKLLRCKWK